MPVSLLGGIAFGWIAVPHFGNGGAFQLITRETFDAVTRIAGGGPPIQTKHTNIGFLFIQIYF